MIYEIKVRVFVTDASALRDFAKAHLIDTERHAVVMGRSSDDPVGDDLWETAKWQNALPEGVEYISSVLEGPYEPTDDDLESIEPAEED